MKTVIIVQARMSSTRLPGKVLKRVLDKPLLEHQIERIRRVRSADEIVVATSVNHADEEIVEFCGRLSLPFFRGEEQDVLSRYHSAAREFHADVVVRLTSDCPVIDPSVIEKVLRHYFDHVTDFDYVSNCLTRTYPRGMDTEVFPFRVLEQAFYEAAEAGDREHVTPFIYRQADRFRLSNVAYHEDCSRHRWTVDTEEDFTLIRRIIESLYPFDPAFRMEDILTLLESDPGLFRINAHVEQKKKIH
jgi:spore coat polysaccharide biosynthesis protein SpsF